MQVILWASRGRMRPIWQGALCVALIAGMAYQGSANLKKQWSVSGEYSNPVQEKLFDWINENTATGTADFVTVCIVYCLHKRCVCNCSDSKRKYTHEFCMQGEGLEISQF